MQPRAVLGEGLCRGTPSYRLHLWRKSPSGRCGPCYQGAHALHVLERDTRLVGLVGHVSDENIDPAGRANVTHGLSSLAQQAMRGRTRTRNESLLIFGYASESGCPKSSRETSI